MDNELDLKSKTHGFKSHKLMGLVVFLMILKTLSAILTSEGWRFESSRADHIEISPVAQLDRAFGK